MKVASEALGHQDFDFLPKPFFPGPAKEFHRLCVGQHHLARAVNDDHGIGRRFKDILEFLVSSFAGGDVTNGALHHGAFVGIERTQAALDRKFVTSLAQPAKFKTRTHGSGARLLKLK